MTISNEIITDLQARMLDTVRAYGAPMTHLGLQQQTGLSRSEYRYALTELRSRGLLIDTKVRAYSARGFKTWVTGFRLSPLGIRALAQHRVNAAKVARYTGPIVPPARINRLEGFHREPPMAKAYCRNDGFKHILRRGVAC